MDTTYTVSSRRSSGTAPTELDLIRFSQSGDRESFSHLYEAHLDKIYRYIFFRVFDHEVAEDITSLVFLKVWEHLGTFNGGQIPFSKWVFRIAHNAVIDYYRTRRTPVPLEDVNPLEFSYSDRVDEKIDLKILSHKLANALKELTTTQREVLLLRFIWGMTTSEIARRLHKQQGAIRALQMRGLRRLAKDPAIQSGRTFE